MAQVAGSTPATLAEGRLGLTWLCINQDLCQVCLEKVCTQRLGPRECQLRECQLTQPVQEHYKRKGKIILPFPNYQLLFTLSYFINSSFLKNPFVFIGFCVVLSVLDLNENAY